MRGNASRRRGPKRKKIDLRSMHEKLTEKAKKEAIEENQNRGTMYTPEKVKQLQKALKSKKPSKLSGPIVPFSEKEYMKNLYSDRQKGRAYGPSHKQH